MNRKISGIVSTILASAMLIIAPAYGAEEISETVIYPEKLNYTAIVNGVKVNNPIYENGEHIYLLPVREVAELLGYTVKYYGKEQVVIVNDDNTSGKIFIGEDQYLIDDDMIYELQAASELKDGKVYVPSLFFSKIFGVTLAEEANNVIRISQTKKIAGTITAATRNTLTLLALDGKEYCFDTAKADKREANGLIIGTYAALSYTGNLNVPESLKATAIKQEKKTVKTVTGTVKEIAENSIKITVNDKDYSLGTMEADKSDCQELFIGSSVTLTYTGELAKPTQVKILTMTQK